MVGPCTRWGAPLCQLALLDVGEVRVEALRDDEVEHRVAKELQALVRAGRVGVLVGKGRMRQREPQQRLVAKSHVDLPLKLIE